MGADSAGKKNPPNQEKNGPKSDFYQNVYWRAERAQPRARPCSALQSILLTKEMLFDYLVGILAHKSASVGLLENWSFFRKVAIFLIFSKKSGPILKRYPPLRALFSKCKGGIF